MVIPMLRKKDVESTLDEDIELVISSDPKTTIASINRGSSYCNCQSKIKSR